MGGAWILPTLTFGTMFAFLAFAAWNKKSVEEKIELDDRKSSLAADGDPHRSKI